MDDITTVYYIVGIIVGLLVIGGAARRWVGRNKDNLRKAVTVDDAPKPKKIAKPKEQIACDECQTVFAPKWKERETSTGKIIEYAVCPRCGFENEFEIDDDEDDEDSEYDDGNE